MALQTTVVPVSTLQVRQVFISSAAGEQSMASSTPIPFLSLLNSMSKSQVQLHRRLGAAGSLPWQANSGRAFPTRGFGGLDLRGAST